MVRITTDEACEEWCVWKAVKLIPEKNQLIGQAVSHQTDAQSAGLLIIQLGN